MESISSMKIIDGAFFFAKSKISLTILAPSPIYIYTNWEPASLINEAFDYAAHALAIIVLPVPGGPYIKTPLGGCIPISSNNCLWRKGKTTASLNS